MAQSETQHGRADVGAEPLLTAEGFVGLDLESSVPGQHWNIPDDEVFDGFLNNLDRFDGKPVAPRDIVVFEHGKFGDLISRDFGKIGKIVTQPDGMVIEAGIPYIVSKGEETHPGEKRGHWKLEVVREAAPADYILHLEARSRGLHDRRFCQVSLYEGKGNRLVGKMEIGDDGSRAYLRDEKPVRVPVELPQEIRGRVSAGETWIGEISERSSCYLFTPHLPETDWERVFIIMENGTPVVREELYTGLEDWGSRVLGQMYRPEDVAEILPRLPYDQQLRLADVWNNHWGRKMQRLRQEEEAQENEVQAASRAWEAYKDGTVDIIREGQYSKADEQEDYHTYIPVTLAGRRYDVDIDDSPDEALERYDGDWRAYSAAQALRINDNWVSFLGALAYEEGIRLQPEAIFHLRPDTLPIDVEHLEQEDLYHSNGHRWGREPIARDYFKHSFGEEIVEFEDGAIKLILSFVPSLYEETLPETDHPAIEAQVPKVVFKAGYLLDIDEVVVTPKEEMKRLPAHIQQRIRGIVNGYLAGLQKPSGVDFDHPERFRWLAGKKWEDPAAGSEMNGQKKNSGTGSYV